MPAASATTDTTTKTINTELLKTLTFPFPDEDSKPQRRGNLVITITEAAHLGRRLLTARAAVRVGCAGLTIVIPENFMVEVALACPEATLIPLATGAIAIDAAVTGVIISPSGPQFAGLNEIPGATLLAGRKSASDGWERIAVHHENAGSGDPITVTLNPDTMVKGADGTVYANEEANANIVTGAGCAVLAGTLAGLLAQGMPSRDAALWGVHLHGLASEAAAKDLCAIAVTGRDIVERLPGAVRYAVRTYAPVKESARPGLRRIAP